MTKKYKLWLFAECCGDLTFVYYFDSAEELLEQYPEATKVESEEYTYKGSVPCCVNRFHTDHCQ